MPVSCLGLHAVDFSCSIGQVPHMRQLRRTAAIQRSSV